ncbi:hypothetical protein H7992_05070 [Sporosarcina sp. resist]|uniref:hypothetical protein n=1 Tax=Sporosarcina sp. resist TaxID=2762563 RepID=UPI00164D14E6|nr:hypothetical protein [Sporosarcina sp. resist]QNK89098.1 hypothetical protein H7992_05070 [Sporosarcina sp. resist]
MDCATMTKFVLLVVVAATIVFVSIKMYFGTNEQAPEGFEGDNGFGKAAFTETITLDLVDSDFEGDKSSSGMNDSEADSNEVAGETDSNTLSKIEETDFMNDYVQAFGDKAFEEGKETAKQIVRLRLEEVMDKTEWEPYATTSFFDDLMKDIPPYSDGLMRVVKDLSVYPTEAENEMEMKFGVMATWNLSDGEHTIKEKTGLYYITLVQDSNKRWVAKALFET